MLNKYQLFYAAVSDCKIHSEVNTSGVMQILYVYLTPTCQITKDLFVRKWTLNSCKIKRSFNPKLFLEITWFFDNNCIKLLY